jgi:N6-adenosine-specific RNA methylase IME4
MAELFNVAIPSGAQRAAEALGLTVHHSITTGATIRGMTRVEAEIAVECLRDWGFTARIVAAADVEPPRK